LRRPNNKKPPTMTTSALIAIKPRAVVLLSAGDVPEAAAVGVASPGDVGPVLTPDVVGVGVSVSPGDDGVLVVVVEVIVTLALGVPDVVGVTVVVAEGDADAAGVDVAVAVGVGVIVSAGAVDDGVAVTGGIGVSVGSGGGADVLVGLAVGCGVRVGGGTGVFVGADPVGVLVGTVAWSAGELEGEAQACGPARFAKAMNTMKVMMIDVIQREVDMLHSYNDRFLGNHQLIGWRRPPAHPDRRRASIEISPRNWTYRSARAWPFSIASSAARLL
jgi:hypothetical protein